jgi:N-acetylglutamate synthase-like GNAT family acetyltransferase
MREYKMIVIKRPATKDDFKAYYALRYHVERESGGHPKGTEKDDFEPISIHFMAVDLQTGEVVGVARLFEKDPGEGQISHLAVHEDWERQGIGRKLVEAVEAEAHNLGYKRLGGMAHQSTTGFFEKLGFRVKGMHSNPFGNVQLIWTEKEL